MKATEHVNQKMGVVECLLVSAGGYPPKIAQTYLPEEREPIMKLGWAVLIAAAIAAINWAVAGWVYSDGQPPQIRAGAISAAALLGALIVIVFDRGFLFFADVAVEKRLASTIAFAALRIGIILLVSSLTSQAVMPLILGDELKAHALTLRESSERSRMANLNEQFDTATKASAAEDASSEVSRLASELPTIPDDIQREIDAGKACWSSYTRQKRALITDGVPEADARSKLGGLAAGCRAKATRADTDLSTYRERTRKALETATEQKAAAVSALHNATQQLESRVQEASAIEKEAIAPTSAAVLWSLLRSDVGAAAKWLTVTLTLLCLELLPLLLKLQAGRSPIGAKIAASRAIANTRVTQELLRAEHDRDVTAALTAASRRAVAEALDSPSVQATFRQVFETYLAAYAPTHAVTEMMTEFSSRQYDLNGFKQRHPQYAEIISEAWAKAIEETKLILTRGGRFTMPVGQAS